MKKIFGFIFSFIILASVPVLSTNFTATVHAQENPSTGSGSESYALNNPVAVAKTSDGYTAQAVVVVTNPTKNINYQISLGKSTLGATTCSFESKYDSIGRYTAGESALAINKTWTLTEGVYCLGVQKETAVVSNTYKTVVPVLTTFVVGGSSINPGTTGGLQPNENGCLANGTNEYCPLVILPNIGETGTGKISFTECYIDGVKVEGKSGFGCYLNNLIRIVIALIGILGVVMVIIGGIEYWSTTSGAEKGTAKGRILGALLGIVLALGSYVILRTINPKLVELEVTIPSIVLSLEGELHRTSGGGTYTGGGGNPNVTKNITTFDSMLAASAAKNKVNCTFLKADMYAESGGNPNATSPVGARGLMQLMPATFSGLMPGPTNIMDPATNIEAGARYFAQLQAKACNGKQSNTVCSVAQQQYIIAAYNGGPKSNSESEKCPGKTWWQCEQNSGYAETRAYVQKVQKNYDKLVQEKWGC